jgi:lysophospholipase L1-like esterase
LTPAERPPSPSSIGRGLGVVLQLVAALFVTAILLVAIEIVAGQLAPPDIAEALRRRGDDYVMQTLGNLDIAPELNPCPLVRDPYVLWRNKPLARKTQPVNPRRFGRDDTWTLVNNSEGYRGPERPYRNDTDGVYRILCVGDSITFGFNVDQDASYPRRLEAALRERHPGRRIEVVDAGVPGWSWLQGLRFLQAEGMGLHPDLVIAGHGTNDQFFRAEVTDRERMPVGGEPAPEVRPAAEPFYQRTNTYRLIRKVAGIVHRGAALSPGCRAQLKESAMCHRVSVDDIDRAVREVAGLVRGAGGDFLAINVDFQETAAVTGVRRAVDAERVPFIDFVERFRTLRKADEEARVAHLGLAPAGATPPSAGAQGPRRVVFRALLDAPPGDAAVSVRGGAFLRSDFDFAHALHDDGTDGDERAGDGVFSGTVDVPANVGGLEYAFWIGDTAEFTPLPPQPSTNGRRLLRVEGDTVAPIDHFAELFMMAERTHPDARGQATIAEGIAERVEQLPSFAAWRASGAP